jgi:hypothetical protein
MLANSGDFSAYFVTGHKGILCNGPSIRIAIFVDSRHLNRANFCQLDLNGQLNDFILKLESVLVYKGYNLALDRESGKFPVTQTIKKQIIPLSFRTKKSGNPIMADL